MITLLKVCILLSGCKFFLQAISIGREDNNVGAVPYTWMGMLMDTGYVSPEHQRSTLVVLINDNLAIGVAKQIVYRDPQNTEVIFWHANGGSFLCGVERYKVHPEYYEGKESTLALVYLIPPEAFFEWQPIDWPRSDFAPSSATIVGIVRENRNVHQVQKRVVTCDKRRCNTFYVKRFGSKAVSNMPRYTCYRENLPKVSRCAYSSGTALVYTTTQGYVTLFGIGVGGVGCCSRWVHFHPFRAWIQDSSRPNLRSTRYKDDQGMYDYYQDLDLELMANLYKNDMEITYATGYARLNESNTCWNDTARILIYHEQAHYRTWLDGSIGYYALSLYDHRNPPIDCASLWVDSNRSSIKWWVTSGFQQEDIEHYVKKVPYSPDRKIGPKIVFLMDKYRKYHNISVTHISFKFQYDQEAELEILYYGQKN